MAGVHHILFLLLIAYNYLLDSHLSQSCIELRLEFAERISASNKLVPGFTVNRISQIKTWCTGHTGSGAIRLILLSLFFILSAIEARLEGIHIQVKFLCISSKLAWCKITHTFAGLIGKQDIVIFPEFSLITSTVSGRNSID